MPAVELVTSARVTKKMHNYIGKFEDEIGKCSDAEDECAEYLDDKRMIKSNVYDETRPLTSRTLSALRRTHTPPQRRICAKGRRRGSGCKRHESISLFVGTGVYSGSSSPSTWPPSSPKPPIIRGSSLTGRGENEHRKRQKAGHGFHHHERKHNPSKN